MKGLILLVVLMLFFLWLGLRAEKETAPVRLTILAVVVAMTGWYLLF